jgi:hypothetical protein
MFIELKTNSLDVYKETRENELELISRFSFDVSRK